MAEARPAAAARPQRNPQAAPERPANIEDLLNRLENEASRLLQTASGWVERGEQLLSEGRGWLDSHPLSKDLAQRVAKRTNLTDYIPNNMEDAREKARLLRERARGTMQSQMQSVRTHPWDTVLIGTALGLAALVLVKNR